MAVIPRGVPVVCVVWIEVSDGDAGAELLVESDGSSHVVRNDDAVFFVPEHIDRGLFGLLHELCGLLLFCCCFAAVSERWA